EEQPPHGTLRPDLEDQQQLAGRERREVAQLQPREEGSQLADELADLTRVQAQESSSSTL
ncbi:MAG: hypothetical protein KDB60_20550, partial [Propionibacteriaceae bacterium]|nr:hypothetical protein [Propionibacteriaceae bacterium]